MLAELAALRREVADLRALVARLVCAGEVIEHDPAGQRVRVRLPGDDDVTTAWLPVLTPRARGTRLYSVPQVGEQVWCLFLPDGGLEGGAVIGSSYNQADGVPSQSGDVFRLEFADGGHLTQDAAAGTLAIHAVGALTISAATVTIEAQSVTLDTPATVATGTLNVAKGIGGGDGAAIIGSIEATEDVIGQRDVLGGPAQISLVEHLHTGVQPGGGTTGQPVNGA